jgi:hypothetical protein
MVGPFIFFDQFGPSERSATVVGGVRRSSGLATEGPQQRALRSF